VLESLQQRFPDAWKAFSASQPGADTADFTDYLGRQGHLSGSDLLTAHRRTPVQTVLLTNNDTESEVETTEVRRNWTLGYQRIGQLGRGGMAVIHVAKDHRLMRRVAYKVADARSFTNRGHRFVVEAQVTAQLDHPNVVPVYALEEDGHGELAYAMKLIDGGTLDDVRKDAVAAHEKGDVPARLQPSELLDHFLKVCDAVGYAHDKGVIHRDLKPSNIMVGSHREVYVMDWGLAKLTSDPDVEEPQGPATLDVDASAVETQVGDVMGTPLYMSPEQATGDEVVGPLSDQFSLGMILQELITGKRARKAGRLFETMKLASVGFRNPMTRAMTGKPVPKELKAIVERATAFHATDRYVSVHAFAADLRRYRSNQEVQALPDNLRRWAARWVSNHRDAALRTILVLATIVALVVAASVSYSSAESAKARHREAKLATFLTHTNAAAAHTSNHFSEVGGAIRSIALTTNALLAFGAPDNGETYYTTDMFFDAEKRPEGIVPSPIFQTEISTRYVDVHHPTPPTDAQRERVQTILPIRHTMRRAQIDLRGRDLIEAENQWINHFGPIFYISMGLDDGTYLGIPGAAWDSTDYDPRERPWYREKAKARTPAWGRPYQESSTGTLVVACGMALEDGNGEYVGVVSAGTSFDYLVASILREASHPAIREFYLVDRDGLVMMRSSDVQGERKRSIDLDETHVTPPFPYPALVEAMKASDDAGHLWVDDRSRLLVQYPLKMNGWRLVIEADTAAVMQ
jgi:eukaryotic-like serine/threonine-protein kinase